MTLRIGLTGGIGSGKSTACRIFAEFKVPIIDADVIANRITRPGKPLLKSLSNIFGKEIMQKNGALDRKKLRLKIFQDDAARKTLEDILHPAIYSNIGDEVKNITAEYCIISIPLLLETGGAEIIDRILIIDVPEKLQLSRASNRDNMDENKIAAIIDCQISRRQRRPCADDLIDNTGSIEDLRKQICDLNKFYRTLCKG